MKRLFIYTVPFERQRSNLGISDEELRQYELEILKNPKLAPVVPGTGGLRKIRFSLANKGQSGGVRFYM